MKRIDSGSVVIPVVVPPPLLASPAHALSHQATTPTLQVGATLVLAAHGVVRIVSIGSEHVGGVEVRMVGFEALRDGTRIWLPEARLGEAGLRALLTREQLPRLLTLLTEGANERRPPCYKWHRILQDKLNRGDLQATVEVLRDLAQLHHERPLSATERHLYDRVREDVITEIALVTHRSPRGVERQLDRLAGGGGAKKR